jgi:uncharacterized protein YidB (DUF937 family)
MGIQDIISKLGGQSGQKGAMAQIQTLFGGQDMHGIVTQLTSAGMGQHVQSWIGMGNNQPVSGQQIQQAVDPAALQQVAQRTGMQPQQVCDHVAQVLPHLIDQATPDGEMPASDSGMMSKGMDALKGMMNR